MFNGRKRDKNSAVSIALRELRGLKRAKKVELFLFLTLVLSTTFLFVILLSSFMFTGYVSYIDARGGTVTTLEIIGTIPTEYWHGLHGLALRVPGYTSQIYSDISSGEIGSIGLFFDCLKGDEHGKEIYASPSPTVNFDSLVPAEASDIDAYLGCSGQADCAVNTFTQTMTVYVGDREISDIPSTYTYKYGGNNTVFQIGALNDGANMVFVAFVNDVQTGYSNETTVNFQMLLPVPPEQTVRYYFFNDPYDECPPGGSIGEALTANLGGYVKDLNGNPIENASVIVVGETEISDVDGYYNFSFDVNVGTYNVIVRADGYDDLTFNVDFDFTNYSLQRNVTLRPATPGVGDTINPTVYGSVKDSSGNAVSGAYVFLGDTNTTTSAFGYYSLSPLLSVGYSPIISYKEGYNNYYSILNFSNDTILLEHNITLEEVSVEYPFETGPYTENEEAPPEVLEQVEVSGEDYWISTKEIYKEVRQNTFIRESIAVYNFRGSTMNLEFRVSDDLKGIVELDNNEIAIPPNSMGEVVVTFYGVEDLGDYNGSIVIGGSLEKVIPTVVKIIEKRQTIETLLINVDLLKDVVSAGENLRYKVTLHNLLSGHSYEVYLKKYLVDANETFSLFLGDERVEVLNSLSFLDNVTIPANFSDGDYRVRIDAEYLNYFTRVVAPFSVQTPIYLYSFFGIPLWVIMAVIAFFSFLFLIYFLYRREQEKKKRYLNSLDFSTLPKKTDKSITLGRIAETKVPAYLHLNNLTTHAIVAGATGGGKSISAQVLIEEALLKNIAVVVFDPTAQWSGMLRKCEDKKMMSFYPKFGLKPQDARAFPGSIRMITDAREIVDVNKRATPGQIQIFTLNKLDPKDIDIFVANVIRQIFRGDPKESPDLKTIIVFDEVHRLLSKFGGSGEGFLQIERACREFRKWGIGVLLVSQVLSDFVGEIKANINNEVQMRTIEENDLERIKTKYGPEFLKSLVKSEVGVGMFQNAEYNRGKPYFINFRPILHNTRRLSDEELDQYNQYNETADDIEFQIEELEKLKVDVFDLKMELKLVKDKIMTGNFAVVDIYLQGLKPRIEKSWEKLGKTPPKRQKQLANLEDIKKDIEAAKKARAKFEAQTKGVSGSNSSEAKPAENVSSESSSGSDSSAVPIDTTGGGVSGSFARVGVSSHLKKNEESSQVAQEEGQGEKRVVQLIRKPDGTLVRRILKKVVKSSGSLPSSTPPKAASSGVVTKLFRRPDGTLVRRIVKKVPKTEPSEGASTSSSSSGDEVKLVRKPDGTLVRRIIHKVFKKPVAVTAKKVVSLVKKEGNS